MAKQPYLPKDDAGKLLWLTNFAAKLPHYQSALGLVAADVTAMVADKDFFTYVCNSLAQITTFAQQWTAYKNAARDGKAASLGNAPVVPVLTAAPAVAPGIFLRTAALVARIKKQPGYTESIGEALGIIGAEQTVDLATVKPVLQATPQPGGVLIAWTKQGLGGVEIHVDRGTGFAFLAVDTVPDYVDTQLPAAGQPALWKYKAIYRQNDERVGLWSDVVSVAVAG